MCMRVRGCERESYKIRACCMRWLFLKDKFHDKSYILTFQPIHYHFMYIFHATHEGNAKVYDMLAGSEPKLSHLVSKTEAMTNGPSSLLGS